MVGNVNFPKLGVNGFYKFSMNFINYTDLYRLGGGNAYNLILEFTI